MRGGGYRSLRQPVFFNAENSEIVCRRYSDEIGIAGRMEQVREKGTPKADAVFRLQGVNENIVIRGT